jgi:hypothetical protein
MSIEHLTILKDNQPKENNQKGEIQFVLFKSNKDSAHGLTKEELTTVINFYEMHGYNVTVKTKKIGPSFMGFQKEYWFTLKEAI